MNPELNDLWEITVTDPSFSRVRGSTLCRVSFREGVLCWTHAETGEFWLDINDSAIDSKRFVYRNPST